MDHEQVHLSYRQFIDAMVSVAQKSVRADRISVNGHTERTNDAALPLRAEETVQKQFCLGLGPDQKAVLAQLLIDERETAVHDVLAYLEWAISTERLTISGNDESFLGKAEETMLLDFMSRSAGDEWQGP